jgi:DNA polymerase-3 subunit alpha
MSSDGSGFVNLHTHSHYSILDGYATPEEYLRRASSLGQSALGLTDHGNLYGVHELIKTARDLSRSKNKKGKPQNPIYVKPIVGIEAYVAPLNEDGARHKGPIYYGQGDHESDVSASGAYLHLTLLAINDIGFHNLIKLSTESFKRENFYYKNRIDQDMLAKWNEGIVAFTGCPSGEIQTRLRLGQKKEAYDYARRMMDLFPDRYYVEIMQHHMKRGLEREILPELVTLADDLNLPLVATNDAHYSAPEDALHQDEMLCIQTNTTGGSSYMNDATKDEGGPRFSFDGDDYYLKSEEEMLSVFPDDQYPNAVSNTVRIANMVGDWWSNDDALIDLPHAHGGIDEHMNPSGKGFTYFSSTTSNVNGFQHTDRKRMQSLIDDGSIALGPYDLSLTKGIRPKITIPEGWSETDWFKKKINDGYENRRVMAGDSPEVLAESKRRINEEMPVFVNNDFTQYMLVVQDYINAARQAGISIGYGRGSVGGSEIAYLLDISRTDPIKHDLLFERFLNPERVSPPDVDTDFQSSRKNEVLVYAKSKYGSDKVANIITFGTFGCKQAFRDAAKIYHMLPNEVNLVSGMIPDGSTEEGNPTMEAMYDPESKWYPLAGDFRKAVADGGDKWSKIGDAAIALQGRIKSLGTHACGVIMSDEPISDRVPLCWESNEKKAAENVWVDCRVQWGYEACESMGLIKMDFLSLSDLDVVQDTLHNIDNIENAEEGLSHVDGVVDQIVRAHKDPPDFDAIVHGDMDDIDTYAMLSKGDSIGCFQLGSEGQQDLLRLMRPTEFNDIVAINALYRPGPMKQNAHLAYSNRKNGREPVYVINKDLDRAFKGTPVEDILSTTWGCMVYQEQIMQISRRLSGYSRGEADSLRKAIGHKIPAEMERNKTKFIEGAMTNNADHKYHYTKSDVENLWSFIEGFAKYGFNKSHSVSYAITAYETAYLKAHYPSEFYAALMTEKIGKKDDLAKLLASLRARGLNIGAININNSTSLITSAVKIHPDDPDIVFGFAMIKKISANIGDEIVAARKANGGRFKDFDDFIKHAPDKVLKKGVLERLADVGAFDCLGMTRKGIADNAEAITIAENKRRSVSKQMAGSLFSMIGNSASTTKETHFDIPNTKDLPWLQRLDLESDLLGMTISGEPMDHIGEGLNFYMSAEPDHSLYTTVKTLNEAAAVHREAMRNVQSDGVFRRRARKPVVLAGSLVDVEKKKLKSGNGFWLSCKIKDSTGVISARMGSKQIDEISKRLGSDPIENVIYCIHGSAGDDSVSIQDLEIIPVDDEGRVPIFVRISEGSSQNQKIKDLKLAFNRHPGNTPVCFNIRKKNNSGLWNYDQEQLAGYIALDEDAIIDYEAIVGRSRLCSWVQHLKQRDQDMS